MNPGDFHSLVAKFDPISLEQMDNVSFLSRMDTKYLLTSDKLYEVISEILKEYYILEIDGTREFSYNSSYVDTAGFGMYFDHHNKRKNRYKCRLRVYENSGLSFWEIKHKTNRNLTIKKRIRINPEGTSEEDIQAFIHKYSPFHFNNLEPKLISRFSRMTFVNKNMTERVTVDRELSWQNNSREIHLDGLAVVEVKNESKASLAEIFPILHKHGIRPGSFSKYTFGCAFLYSDLKQNLLKQKINVLTKYCHATSCKCVDHA